MVRILCALCFLSLAAQSTQAILVYEDDFTTHPTAAWNNGGGFVHLPDAGKLKLSTFGGNFGQHGDAAMPIGVAGLNSAVGYGELTVEVPGEPETLGMNFNIGAGANYANAQQAIMRLNFAQTGPGNYQFLWNNTGVTEMFDVPGWSGTLGPYSSAIVIDGDNPNAMFGTTTSGSGVNEGDAAIRFGFWGAAAGATAIVDDFKIYDSLMIMTTTCGPGDFDCDGIVAASDLNLVLNNWGASADPVPDGWINDLPEGTISAEELNGVLNNWGATTGPVAVPEPNSSLLLIASILAIATATQRRRP